MEKDQKLSVEAQTEASAALLILFLSEENQKSSKEAKHQQ